MPQNIETEIRKALDAKAHEVDVPDTLATRTLDLAREQGPQPLAKRLGSWREARRMRARPSGYPRVLYATGAAAVAVLVFVVGTLATRPVDHAVPTQASGATGVEEPSGDERALRRGAVEEADEGTGRTVLDLPALSAPGTDAGVTSSGDAASGQIAGTITNPGGSADQVRANTSEDADAESGDGDFSDQAIDVETGDADASQDASAFVGLTAGTAGDVVGAPTPSGAFLDPKIVRTADIRVAVKDFDPAWEQANDVAAKHGGAVIGSRTQQIADRIAQGTVTMRVPSARLEQVIADLRGLGTLAELNTTGDDIAEQIDGVKDKVADARTEERTLIDQQTRAPTAAARSEATTRLEAVRKDIDALKTKQRKYEDQVEFSAVTATIVEDTSLAEDDSVLGRALDTGVGAALTILAGTLVLVGGLLPLALLALAVWFVVRTIRRRRPAA
jgi:hypothetical protein